MSDAGVTIGPMVIDKFSHEEVMELVVKRENMLEIDFREENIRPK